MTTFNFNLLAKRASDLKVGEVLSYQIPGYNWIGELLQIDPHVLAKSGTHFLLVKKFKTKQLDAKRLFKWEFVNVLQVKVKR